MGHPDQGTTGAPAKHNPYGRGFKIRMGVLLGLLALAAILFAVDTYVMKPNATAKIKEVRQLVLQGKSDDGHGIPKDKVHEVVGWAPSGSNVETKGEWEVETYNFPRVIPFVRGEYMTVVYKNKAVTDVIPNGTYKLNNKKEEIFTPSEEDRKMPQSDVGA